MTFLPIVERELRVAARKVTTHRMWLFSAACASAIFLILLVMMDGPSRTWRAGGQIFVAISIMTFAFALFAGVFLTADCLCSERNEGTLGLLFLTDLRGYDVVLGKLVATSLVSVYTVVAVIPILGVPLLMGGVTGAEFGRTVLALMTTLLFSLSIGMFASAVSRDTRAAMLLTVGILLGLTGVLFLLSLLASEVLKLSVPEWILLPSPLLSLITAFDSRYLFRAGASQFWWSLAVMLGLSAGLLQFSSLWLPRSWSDVRKRADGDGSSVMRRKQSSTEPGSNPFASMMGRERFPGRIAMLFLGALGIGWLVCVVLSLLTGTQNFHKFFTTSFLMTFGLHIIVKGLMAIQSSRRLCDDRRTGALELLLVTRLELNQILDGHREVFRRQFRPLVWALTLMNAVLVAVVFRRYPDGLDEEIVTVFTIFFTGGVLLLWVDFYAIGWVGMWTALRSQRPHRAALGVILRVLIIPWLAIFLFFAASFSRGVSEEALYLCWFLWMLLCITTSCMAAAKSKRELTNRFRAMAAGELPIKQSAESRPWSPEWSGAGTETQTSHGDRNSRLPAP